MNVPRLACLLVLSCAGTCVSGYAALTEPVGTSSSLQTATVTITTAGTLETISVLTQGAIGLDFNAASGGTCSVGHAYAVGSTCTVNYTFKPTRPWIRYGGVALFDSAGNLLGNMYLTGTGTGPQPIFPSNSGVTTLGSGSISGYGVAVDGNGNVYLAVPAEPISEIVAVNGRIPTNPTIRILGSGFEIAYDVAVDGSGNVYVADIENSGIKEMVAVNGVIPVPPTIRTLGSGLIGPSSLTVDGSGNVYVADAGDGIKEIVAVNGVIPAHPTINILAGGYSDGVAVDGNGNVYVADFSSSTIREILAVNGSVPVNPTIRTLGSGFGVPYNLAVDGSGNIYVADGGDNTIKEMVAVNGSIPADPTINILASGFVRPTGVAVDGSGNVYLTDPFGSRVAELDRTDPPSLSFASTPIGLTSSDSPQSVTLQNFGNATLAGSSLSISSNWEQVAGGGRPEDCTASFSLAPGAECNLDISFEPTETGALTGSATFTDNALNVADATQQVQLSGTGLPALPRLSVSATALAFGNLALGQQEDMSLQLTNTGATSAKLAPAINGPSFTVPPSENGCGTAIPAGHNCILSVRFLPRTYGGHGDTLTLAGSNVIAPTVQLTGQTLGVGAEIGLLNFGTISSGTTAILFVPMVNYAVAKNVTFSTSINGSSFKVLTTGNTCLSGVTAAQQCTIPVEFSPAAVGGYANVLTITASSGDVSVVKLDGTASQP